jgi:soluble lytic murein transglycosylase
MQLQPATANLVARRWHLASTSGSDLYDPAIAIPLGAAYLKDMLERYHGELALTLAAYNAGPLPVARWTPTRPLDADIWIENIPYNETRSYVQRVLEHIVAYSGDHMSPPAPLLPLLAPVKNAAPDGGDPPTLH